MLNLLIIIILIAIIIIAIRIGGNTYDNRTETIAGTITFFCIIFLIVFIINIAFVLPDQRIFIQKLPKIQEQLDLARERNNPIELAAIQQKILEYNDQILECKEYKNYNWFYGLFYIDEWDTVKLIQ